MSFQFLILIKQIISCSLKNYNLIETKETSSYTPQTI